MIKELTPPSIRELQHLVDTFDTGFEELKKHIIKVLIYPRIDEIEDEKLLDLLAWQFHIEGYEQAQTIQDKRNLIKNTIELHRYKGTPYAIKKVFESLGLDASLQEWFDYDGNPYKFKVLVKNIIQDEDTYIRFTKLINEYKNVRSWLDAIGFHREHSQTLYYASAQKDGKHYHIGLHVDVSVEPYTIHTGFAHRVGTSYQIGIYEPQVSVEQAGIYAGGVQRIASYMAIYPELIRR
ncbi:phage tail protein I [Thermocrinis sp.]|jgi:phage tail P2-like protein|uniref:phage tail protein I n=1 Tax=Thermocrinis sp. TaxID=2024383 RepID=UPI003C0811BC